MLWCAVGNVEHAASGTDRNARQWRGAPANRGERHGWRARWATVDRGQPCANVEVIERGWKPECPDMGLDELSAMVDDRLGPVAVHEVT